MGFMNVEGEERKLVDIAFLLKNARLKAQELPCKCEESATCKKHKIVNEITKAEETIKTILAAF